MSNTGAIRAGKAFVEAYLDKTKLVRGLKSIQGDLQRFGAGISAIGARSLGIGAALAAPLTLATKCFMSAGDALDKMSSRVGVSVEFLSQLSHAAQIGGTDINTLEKGVRRLQRTAMDAQRGLSTAVDAFDELGVSATNADGTLKGTEQLFMESVSALSKVTNETKRAALAQMLFGRAGTALLPMLKDGKDGLKAWMDEAVELGIVMTEKDAKAAAEVTDALTRLTSVGKMAFFRIGAAVADSGIIDSMRSVLTLVKEWVSENGDIVRTVAKVAGGLIGGGAAMLVFGKAVSAVGGMIGGLFTATQIAGGAISFLSTTFGVLLNPLGLTIAAIAAASAGLLYLARNTGPVKAVGKAIWDYLGDVRKGFGSLIDDATKAWAGISDALEGGRLDLAWNVVLSTLKLELARLVQDFYNILEPFGTWWTTFSYGLSSVFIDALSETKKGWAELQGWVTKHIEKPLAESFYMAEAGVGGRSKDIINQDWLDAAKKNPEIFDAVGGAGSVRNRVLSGISPSGIYSITPEMQKALDAERKRRLDAWKTYDETHKDQYSDATIDAATRQREKEIEDARKAQQDILTSDMERAKDAATAAKNKRNDDLSDAIKSRDKALIDAANAKKKHDEERAKNRNKNGLRFGDADTELLGKGKVSGTFSAAEAAAMGHGSPMLAALTKIEKHMQKFVYTAEETSRNIKTLNVEMSP